MNCPFLISPYFWMRAGKKSLPRAKLVAAPKIPSSTDNKHISVMSSTLLFDLKSKYKLRRNPPKAKKFIQAGLLKDSSHPSREAPTNIMAEPTNIALRKCLPILPIAARLLSSPQVLGKAYCRLRRRLCTQLTLECIPRAGRIPPSHGCQYQATGGAGRDSCPNPQESFSRAWSSLYHPYPRGIFPEGLALRLFFLNLFLPEFPK